MIATTVALLSVPAAAGASRDPPTSVTATYTCATVPIEVSATATAAPATVPVGGRATLTVLVTVAPSTALSEGSAVVIGWPLAGDGATVRSAGLFDLAGATGGTWSADGGRLTTAVTADATAVTAGLSFGVEVIVRLVPTTAAGPLALVGPDALSLGDPAAPPACEPASAPPTLAALTVVDPADPPDEPEPPTTEPPEDPAAPGDAPSPPSLPADEIPPLPPPADPGTASELITGDTQAAQAQLAEQQGRLAEVTRQIRRLEDEERALAEAEATLEAERAQVAGMIARSEADLEAWLIAAYIELVRARPPATSHHQEPGTRNRTADELLDERARLVDRQRHLAEREGRLVADRDERDEALAEARARARALRSGMAGNEFALATFQGGGGVAISGFRFVVGGEHTFTDTWHAPRSGGRLHQGTDIFADEGTPVLAAERGVLAGLGEDTLGGTKLWLVGESGTHYYYAHLSAYAPGAADGVVVAAGTVIGFVGSTGNARTTAPHLHFEVHPQGGDAVDAYPMLAAADGVTATSEPVAPASEPAPDVLPSGLHEPEGVAIGSDGRTYVTEPDRDRVLVLSPEGETVAVWGPALGEGERLVAPTGIAVGPQGDVLVVDSARDRVVVLDPAGALVAAWGTSGAGPGQLDHPSGVAVDRTGRVYVADTFNHRVQVFDADGRLLDRWGGFGTAAGRFDTPSGVAVGPGGGVYVADSFNNRVQRFEPDGRYVRSWAARLDQPGALAVGPGGAVLVADTGHDRVLAWYADGRRRSWPVDDPRALALGEDGRWYVTDAGADHLVVLGPGAGQVRGP